MFICIYHSIYTISFGWCSVRSLCAPTAILRRCRRPYCAATATSHLYSCQDGVSTAFVLSRQEVRAVDRRSMRSHGVHWRCHCVATALLAFPRRAGRHSGCFRSPWERRPGAIAALHSSVLLTVTVNRATVTTFYGDIYSVIEQVKGKTFVP